MASTGLAKTQLVLLCLGRSDGVRIGTEGGRDRKVGKVTFQVNQPTGCEVNSRGVLTKTESEE